MSKPEYMEDLLSIVFLALSVGFISMGLLGLVGILKPSADSMIQEPIMLGIVFSLVGVTFFITQVILKIIASSKRRLHQELLANGIRLNGIVEKVYLQRSTQYGHQSPYRILYSYSWQGNIYHHKSNLLWDKPDLTEGDSIVVYANDSGKSTIFIGN